MLDNEEQATRFAKLVQLFCLQSRAIITLKIVGGVDVMANILVCIAYSALNHLAEDTTSIYLKEFLMYPMESAIPLTYSLTYGMYTEEIRAKLPKFEICQRLRPACPRRVTVLTQTTNQSSIMMDKNTHRHTQLF